MIVFISLILLISILVYLNGKCNENYWKKRGVVFWKKSVFFDYFTGKKAMFQIFDDMYWKHPNDSAVAFGAFTTPSIFIKDMTNVNHMMKTDFQSFNHRGLTIRDDDVLANNVAFLNGPKWKLLRQTLTPLFTPAKLRKAHYIVNRCAEDFVQYLKTNPEKLKRDPYETMKAYTCAALTAAVFGIDTESTFESPFVKIVEEAMKPSLWGNFKFAMSAMSPRLFCFLRLSLFSVKEQFFVETMKQVIKKRKQSGECNTRHDFIELCVNLQNTGLLSDPDTGCQLEPTDELLASQAYVLFLGTLEPSASGLLAILFGISKNPQIKERVIKDIDFALKKYDGQLSYDAITEMKYLKQVFKEALRMYPPVGVITRECTNDTKLPVGDIKIDKGTKMYLPTYTQHHDPKYFPDPTMFNPERFTNEMELIEVYSPFGIGNRACLGQRFAYILIITGVVHILKNFDLESNESEKVNFVKDHMFVRLKDVNFSMTSKA